MIGRLEHTTEQIKQQMNADSFFKVEVVTHWGRPQNFLDAFV
jgi:hypothetical protein